MKINYLNILFCSIIMLQTVSAQTLVINNVTGPASARPGETITLTVMVSNTGTAPSVPTQLRYIQKGIDLNGTKALCPQTATIPALAPNQTRIIAYPMTLTNPIYPPNAKYLGASGLYNNYWFDDYYMVAANDLAGFYDAPKFIFNMAITFPTADISVAVQPNKTRLLNDETWSATYTVRNNSNSIAKQIFVNLGNFANLGRNYYSGLYAVNSITNVAANTFMKSTGGEYYSYGWEIFDLNPGESRQVTFQFSAVISLYQTGPQRTTLPYPSVNPFSNVIDATPESRPALDITYNTTPLPDLAMRNLNITNPTVVLGQILYYKFDLGNLGTGTAGNFKVKAYLSRQPYLASDAVQDGIVPTGNFAAGFIAAQVPAASTMRSPIGEGIYYLVLQVDADNEVIESNESNNIIVSGPINVINPSGCRYQDSLQLVNLYNVTQGANWTNKWNLNAPMTTWYGVGLTPTGCVESIIIVGNQLVGNLPNLNLPELKALALQQNQLTGTIPNFNLPKLEGIGLGNNQFTGAIPNFNLPNLVVLHVENNQLTGNIPYFNLPKLHDLYLSHNQLTGSIPNFNLPSLRIIDFQFNGLSGTLPAFNLPNVDLVFLNNNQLTGNIPNFNLPLLKVLYLNNNQLTGSIPNFNAPALFYLQLNNNQLSGCLPASLHTVCAQAQNVNLSNNPGLANQNITTFCNANVGQCGATLPDLTIANLNLSNNSVPQGQILNYKFDLKNIGTANAAGSFNVRSYVSRDNILSSDDIQDGVVSTANFNAGFTSFQVSGASTMRSPIGTGPYYLILKADADNQIIESNENNNIIVSLPFQVTAISGSYCASKGNTPWNEWIAGVQFSNVNNPNIKQGYADFTGATANVVRGSSYAFTLTQGYSWAGDPSNATTQWRVWIDYNKNNVFDANELAASGTRTTSTATITIPSTATLGATRMRVSLKKTGAPTACEVFDNGEVEDYTVNIAASGGYEKIQKIDNQLVAHFNIFPNPAHQEAFLDLKDFENQRVELKVSDVAGKLLFNQTIEKASVSPHRLNTASLKNGTYFIEIQSLGKRITQQLSILN
jgi:GEVED domain/CARDB/Secretion system C-terminal sorting domain